LAIQKQLRILVCPLDWGMGHTTRCVPLINHIQESGHTAVFAGNSWQRHYITETFGTIETIDRTGYEVRYSKHRHGFMFTLFSQLPRLLKTIKEEHDWLQQTVDNQKIDGIISDNRYGLYHDRVPAVFMTHQVLAQTGLGSMADNLLRGLHFKRIQKFDECWIIDIADNPNLSGKLGHPRKIPANATYIGLLSQIQAGQISEKYLLVLLSGPEPQRTILSDILWKQVKDYNGKVVFIEGSTKANRINIPSHVTYYARVTKETLQPVLEQAELVICRSGYSTLMDLAVLAKKAILIPTPGQTEQEYLGKELHNAGVFYNSAQKNFNLNASLKAAEQFPFKQLHFANGFHHYKTILDKWLNSIQK
jgi:UDP-N-acetylglucosamine transferase subunit ALG13